ncbi:hypothetical protein EJP617_D080 (plasmid) [Erwinia sp. Ejp617]|nr:hypothetical protein EJP617_D080 [Erwinia sp. Ejp617]
MASASRHRRTFSARCSATLTRPRCLSGWATCMPTVRECARHTSRCRMP